MARTSFDGPVRSLNGFYSTGPGMVVNITADTTLTVATHAGKLLTVNDADCKITLPSIVTTATTTAAGPGDDPNTLNNQGATFRFYIETLATDLDIKTDGTDKFVGSIGIGITTSTFEIYSPGASDDVMTYNGTTTGGIVGSYIECTVLKSVQYLVQGVLAGSGSIATPFATS
jgi:hypothetical protein